MKRVLLIVNPLQGKNKSNRIFFQYSDRDERRGLSIVVKTTTGRGDATDFAYKAAKNDECDLIVCAGGDGTFNETLSGVLKSGKDKVEWDIFRQAVQTTLPTALKSRSKPVAAVKSILKNEPTLIDVGKFNDRYFSSISRHSAFSQLLLIPLRRR